MGRPSSREFIEHTPAHRSFLRSKGVRASDVSWLLYLADHLTETYIGDLGGQGFSAPTLGAVCKAYETARGDMEAVEAIVDQAQEIRSSLNKRRRGPNIALIRATRRFAVLGYGMLEGD